MTPSCTTKRLSKPLDRKVLSGKSACARITQVSQITGFKDYHCFFHKKNDDRPNWSVKIGWDFIKSPDESLKIKTKLVIVGIKVHSLTQQNSYVKNWRSNTYIQGMTTFYVETDDT